MDYNNELDLNIIENELEIIEKKIEEFYKKSANVRSYIKITYSDSTISNIAYKNRTREVLSKFIDAVKNNEINAEYNGNNTVFRLDISVPSKFLEDFLPTCLKCFKNLIHLKFYIFEQYDLNETIFTDIGNLTELETFDFISNYYWNIGSIIKSLSYCTKLKALTIPKYLIRNNITTFIDTLNSLSNTLEYLNFSNFTNRNIQNTNIYEIPRMDTYLKFQHLNILINLKEFKVDGTDFILLEEIETKIPNLEELIIYGIVSDSRPQRLMKHDKDYLNTFLFNKIKFKRLHLENFYFCKNHLFFRFIKNLQVKELKFYCDSRLFNENPINDDFLQAFVDSENNTLQKLDVSGNDGIKNLRSLKNFTSLKELKVLDIPNLNIDELLQTGSIAEIVVSNRTFKFNLTKIENSKYEYNYVYNIMVKYYNDDPDVILWLKTDYQGGGYIKINNKKQFLNLKLKYLKNKKLISIN